MLAQAGEGSVRDSLSALDQAIACCGSEAAAPPKCARCSGMFSLGIAQTQLPRRCATAESRRMLEVVEELERNGQNLQHFCRELARYFRNLLVARIAGKPNAPDRGLRPRAADAGRDRAASLPKRT